MAKSIRGAMRLANANAAMWAVGNGLVSTTLVTYMAIELGATGLAVSLILAAPRLAGVLRLAAPALMTTGLRRKQVCISGYLASALVLGVLAAVGGFYSPKVAPGQTLALLVACWCVYHLLEYVATIALWSWLGDWMPPRVRGRLVGWRERYLVAGRILGIGASLVLYSLWTRLDPAAPRWQPLAWSATVGAIMMMLAVVPLVWLQPRTNRQSPARSNVWNDLVWAITDPHYRRLLAYSCWFAVANGVTGAAQNLYLPRVLGIDYSQTVGVRSMMLAGQTAIAPACGRWIDRYGARRLMTAAQLVVATGPLFYFFASPGAPWWFAGAWVVWIAYAPLNVGLDTLKLKLAPTDSTAPSLAIYHALGDLASGVTLVAAGAWFDHRLLVGDAAAMELYAQLFVAGWLLRSSAAWLAWRIGDDGPSAATN